MMSSKCMLKICSRLLDDNPLREANLLTVYIHFYEVYSWIWFVLNSSCNEKKKKHEQNFAHTFQ